MGKDEDKWWEFWFPEVERIAQKEGEYRYPLSEKQDTKEGSGYWSDVQYQDGWWWQTIYDAHEEHSPVLTKRYKNYVDAVEDFSLYPDPRAVEFCWQTSFC